MPGRDAEESPEARGRGKTAPHEAALAEYQIAIRDTTRLNQLLAILGEPAALAVVVDRVLLALSELFAADVAVLLEPSGATALTPFGAIGLPEDLIAEPFSGLAGSYAHAAIQGRAAVLNQSALDDPRMDAQLHELGVETAVWLPVFGSLEVLGVLVLGRCQPIPFSRQDADLLMAMAHRIGMVLDRARADEERDRLEARLRQAEKTESLSRMAAAIAHHFNNKLTAVMGSLELALDDLAAGKDARPEIVNAQDATRRAALVSQLMLAYLGQSLRRRQKLDLVAACHEALPGLIRDLPPNVHLRADLPDGVEPVKANTQDVRQILANLVVNAAEAMAEGGGEILVRLLEVSGSDVVPSPILGHGWTPGPSSYACLEVADSGPGMEPQVLGNAFDPFFSTKFTGRGLGLPVVLGMVRAHDGTVTVDSEVGVGSTFRIYLPLMA
jgi:signal transduction histidine kinase